MMQWPEFAGPVQFGKVAAAGKWEAAVTFRPGEFVTEADALDYLGDGCEVACEAFFGEAFFGIRLQGESVEVARDLATFAQAMSMAPAGADLFAVVGQGLNVALGRDFRYAELGAEGAWNSVGAFRILDPAAAVAGFDEVWDAVLATEVGREASHAKALEFTFDNGRGDGTTHWFAVPVSRGTALERAAVHAALRRAGAAGAGG